MPMKGIPISKEAEEALKNVINKGSDVIITYAEYLRMVRQGNYVEEKDIDAAIKTLGPLLGWGKRE